MDSLADNALEFQEITGEVEEVKCLVEGNVGLLLGYKTL